MALDFSTESRFIGADVVIGFARIFICDVVNREQASAHCRQNPEAKLGKTLYKELRIPIPAWKPAVFATLALHRSKQRSVPGVERDGILRH